MTVFQSQVLLLGFICSKEGRRPDPKKIEQLRLWPPYESCADIVSHLAFCNYLREYFGPEYPDQTSTLRKYCKKEADFASYAKDEAGQRDREWLMTQILEHCVITVPDWSAAARPWLSGRPFEAFLDASDTRWCVCLTQRLAPWRVSTDFGFSLQKFLGRSHALVSVRARVLLFQRRIQRRVQVRGGFHAVHVF